MHMDENNIDSKRLDDMRKSVQGKIKEREDDRNLGVKPKKVNSSKKVKSELNATKGKSSQSRAKKSGTGGNSKKVAGSTKGGSSKSKNSKKPTSNKSKKAKKKTRNISIILVVLTILIFAIYSTFGRGYIEDMQREDFIEMVEPIAVDVYEKYGIYPSVTISRAAIESNWGKSELSKEYFNLFGIKADKSWNGRSVNMNTKEGYNDTENAAFRRYRSYKESIYDYGKFLSENKRYEKAGLFKAKDGKAQAQVLEDAGYATKENSKGELVYADVLINLMDKYNLDKVDAEYDPKVKR
ncbi:mannosyl-glycoprotein endo-beta-N-acetylglucosaminidase [Peptacetobacter hiranonis DSM 13275]|uniref:Mannosyl-glycoprotein endo-beta-N-acetylglucosaminidase n=2 Tax=Peptacetobacter TaxID=2743582 RepID=B6G1A9_PEPHT|nr:mannosyl-glycoprotein endo-beta-N-acetylglucosaminidase [Peptacetobacter hiranonis DSM 13275]